ncbi:hypothetical protein [Synoicihabitans lomoniglobus]|uniref:Uncharacterized protein n=1 Tax=Synoicihabitans lomoniglobus TaxID=2909285 RepID=A0AAE9ZUM3_9BACT|nr:hypothetical protein [Opitutaceae bacterium LMO-M01]WED63329.1 hypothetical protein PXH66_13405 [Opitutaceae bacterium LMO-M01]
MLLPDRVLRGLSVLLPFAVVAVVAWTGWSTVRAQRDQAGPNRLMIPVRIERAAEAHVYYDIGRGLWHGDQAVRQLEGSPDWRVVGFPLPRVPVQVLRFDPLLTPGTFALKAPWLESATGRTIARFPLSAVTPRHQIAAWRIEGDAFVAETLADADDAQVMLELGAPLRVGQPRWPWPEGVVVLGVIVFWGWVRRQPAAWHPRVDLVGWTRRVGRVGGRTGAVAMTVYRSATPRAVLLGAVVVGAGQWWAMRGLSETLDLPMWDETNYAARGIEWLPVGGPLGDLHTGPSYAVQYGLVGMGGSVERAIYRHHYFIKIGGVLMLYLLLARWWQCWPAAAAVALAWGGSWFHTEYPLLVYQAAWMWFLVALWLVDRWPVVALAPLAWAVGMRQDYQFVVPFLIVGVVVMWRRRGGRAREWLSWSGSRRERMVAVAIGVVLLMGIGTVATNVSLGGVGKRGWFAFQQHYAVRAMVVENIPNFNPLAEYPRIMARDFPGATSLREAWQSNPGAIVDHVQWNLGRAVIELRDLWRPAPERRALSWGLWATGALALLAAGRRAPPNANVPWWRVSEVTALGAVVVIGPGLVVLAKGPYMLAIVPLVLAIGAAVLRWGGARLPERGRTGLAVLGLTVSVVTAGAWIGSGSVFEPGSRPLPVRDTLAVLRDVWPTEGEHTLVGYGATSYANYLGHARCRGVEPVNAVSGDSAPDLSVAALLERDQPFAMLVTPEWRQASEVDETPLRERVDAGTWQVRDVVAGQLYWRSTP